MTLTERITNEIENARTRSAWSRGVRAYALDLLDDLQEAEEYNGEPFDRITEKDLLNGAQNWREYSWGGFSLIYNGDICERLASPSEQKKTNNGERRPNAREEWLDTQARALYQAACLILETAEKFAPADLLALSVDDFVKWCKQ